MSVVVVGMEMPRTGWGCPLNSYGICIAKHETSDNCYEELPDWCPLRPLPEKHGRLIDADELEDVFYRFHSQSVGYVQDAETIVEAEGQSEPLTISGTAYYIDEVLYLEPDCNQGEDTT